MTRSRRYTPVAEINVVPYVDVMLVLLVIFMVTAPLLQQGVDVELPKAQAKTLAKTDLPPVIISINKQGQAFVNQGGDPEEVLDMRGMLVRVAALKRKTPDLKIFIKGDKAVAYGDVVQVMGLLQQMGINGVGLITENVEPSRT